MTTKQDLIQYALNRLVADGQDVAEVSYAALTKKPLVGGACYPADSFEEADGVFCHFRYTSETNFYTEFIPFKGSIR